MQQTATTTPRPADQGPRLGQAHRLLAAGVASIAAVVLALAAWVDPSPAGHGTHTQLGLPPCGFEMTTGLPCATCGMTTSFALAAEGRPVASFLNQPTGFILALLTAATALVAGYLALTGADPSPLRRLLTARVAIVLGVLILGGWLYKLSVTLAGSA